MKANVNVLAIFKAPSLLIFLFLYFFDVRGRPSSKKSISSSVQVTTSPQPQNLKQHWQFSSGFKHVGLQIAMHNIICQLEHEKGQPLPVPPFVKLISWFSFTWLLTTLRRQWALLNLWVGYFWAWPLVSRFMQRLTWQCACGYYYWKSPSQPYTVLVNSWLVSLPDQWPWFLVLERDYVCACVQKVKKWHPSQRIAARVCCEQLVKVELELWRN